MLDLEDYLTLNSISNSLFAALIPITPFRLTPKWKRLEKDLYKVFLF